MSQISDPFLNFGILRIMGDISAFNTRFKTLIGVEMMVSLIHNLTEGNIMTI
jgi:hypothetical protein